MKRTRYLKLLKTQEDMQKDKSPDSRKSTICES